MSLFHRKIDIDIQAAEGQFLLLTTSLSDMYHDIRLQLTIDTKVFAIHRATLEMERIPHPACRKNIEKVKTLVGLTVGPGFTKQVLAVFGGTCGCPNLANLVFLTAPLAKNAAAVQRQKEENLSEEEMNIMWHNLLGGVCIAYQQKEEESL